MARDEITFGCIGGSFAHELLADGIDGGQRLGALVTPFGKSQTIYECSCQSGRYYLLLRHSDGRTPIASSFVNYRANIYALKDLGVSHILSWSSARAVSHNYGVGQFVICRDLIDETRQRAGTFFEHGAIVEVRQWPVFCPTIRPILARILDEAGVKHHDDGIYLCSEGPRRETPAEVYKYSTWGANLLGHSLVPEAFLAKELQMCYAGLCLVSGYAETGSGHKPFDGGSLFGELGVKTDRQRVREAMALLPQIIERTVAAESQSDAVCACSRSLAELIDEGLLDGDFRQWFKTLGPARTTMRGEQVRGQRSMAERHEWK